MCTGADATNRTFLTPPMRSSSPNQRNPQRLEIYALAGAVFVESALLALLPPLVPSLRTQFSISDVELGLLVAGYPMGMLAVSRAAGRGCRIWGPPRVCAAGLGLLVVGSILLAFGDGYWWLLSARVLEGVGGGAVWVGAILWVGTFGAAGGRTLGALFGLAFAGTVVGPLLGALAASQSRAAVLTGVAGASMVLAALAWAPGTGRRSLTQGRGHLGRRSRLGVAVMIGVGVATGALLLFLPVRLGDAGVSPIAIGMLFSGAYAAQIVLSPLAGRLADRSDPARPAFMAGLVCAALLISSMATQSPLWSGLFAVAALTAVLALWAPAALLIVDGTFMSEVAAVATIAAWACGAGLGSVGVPAAGLGAAGSGCLVLALVVVGAIMVLTLGVGTAREHARPE